MICYVDSSVVLRHLLNQTGQLNEWNKINTFFSSRILQLECLRTLDRWRLKSLVPSEELSLRLEGIRVILRRMGLLPLSDQVFQKAEQPHSLSVGSLDSIHLATALLWREKHGDDFFFATHDRELGLAARAYGLNVIGV